MSDVSSGTDGIPYAHRLAGRVAVVTGGASGIGRAMCERFASEGAIVVVVDVDEFAGGEVAASVGGKFLRADVTSATEVEELYGAVAAEFGHIDVCCNNAGISPPDDDSILETGLDAWERVQRVNLTSVYLCCKHALPHLLARGRGSIVNTASFVAVLGAATSQISYTASKGGVLALSRELGVQFARQGVRVERALPRSRQHAFAPGALRQGPRARGPPPGPHPHGAFRRGQRDRGGGGVPGQRRLVLHYSRDLPRGRWDLRRLRDPALTAEGLGGAPPLLSQPSGRESAAHRGDGMRHGDGLHRGIALHRGVGLQHRDVSHHGDELGTAAPDTGDDREKDGENVWISRMSIDLV